MSYSSWHVGMKVVCLGNPLWPTWYVLPVAGSVYTIRMIAKQEVTGEIGVLLAEIPDQEHINGGELLFQARCFRPVQPRKTSIEIFNRILRNPKIRIREGA